MFKSVSLVITLLSLLLPRAAIATGTRTLMTFATSPGNAKESEQFEDEMNTMSTRFKARGWTTQTGHAEAPEQTETQIGNALDGARSGDSLMFVLNLHGMARAKGQKSHSVCLEAGEMDLDHVEAKIQAAKARGVKVALVDFSCQSGTTQKLKSAGACIVTSSPEEYFGFGEDYTDHGAGKRGFVAGMVNGVRTDGTSMTLRDLFLYARSTDDSSLNFPQLSSIETPALDQWSGFFKLTDPSGVARQKEFNESRRGLFDFKLASSVDCAQDTNATITQLVAKTDALANTVTAWRRSEARKIAAELKATMAEYREVYAELSKAAAKVNSGLLQNGMADRLLERMTPPSTVDKSTSAITDIDSALEYLKRPLPVHVSIEQTSKEYLDLQAKLEPLAVKAMLAERKLYDLVERHKSTSLTGWFQKNPEDPCADFQL